MCFIMFGMTRYMYVYYHSSSILLEMKNLVNKEGRGADTSFLYMGVIQGLSTVH
jgi:hypothetical protein